ncbi:homoserine kinase [candidate division KSB1 bacterium]|nr:homoserine kinase [candidate division KSB1 bacterium]
MRKRVRAFAPATVANVSCGFDIFGFAMEYPGDEVKLTLTNTPGIEIRRIIGDNGRLPLEADKNTAGVAARLFLEKMNLHKETGVSIELIKNLPLGSGMGSSAASAVAVLYGLNHLFQSPLQRTELLPFAMETERTACGSAHADNAAPALFGGFVLIRSYFPPDIISLPVPDDLYCCLIHPDIEVNTGSARKILSPQIKLTDAVTQMGNVAGFVAALCKSDYDLLSRSMEDVLIEPVRSRLIPHYFELKEEALKAGALGCNIAGSGPSVFALCRSEPIAYQVSEAMKDLYDKINLKSEIYISKINQQGPKILED